VTQPLAAAVAPLPPQLPVTLSLPIPAPIPWVDSSRTALGTPPRQRGSRVLLAVLAIVAIGVLGALGAAAGLELFGWERSEDRPQVAPPVQPEAARPVTPPADPTPPPAADRPEPQAVIEAAIESPPVDAARAAREQRQRKRKRRTDDVEPPDAPATEREPRAWGEPIEPY
jgi:hypothetical protein